jgi:dipeptidyl aminopeptidase/acylaminoacyl peptidase
VNDTRTEAPGLIPRAVLFGNPERTMPQLSPDGRSLAYLAPADGVLAVWLQTVGTNDARVVARDPARPIRNAHWSPDGSRILFLQDAGGDENFHVFAVDPRSGARVDLTPHPGVMAGIAGLDDDLPDTLLVSMNLRDQRFFDVHRMSLATGTGVLDTENPGDVSDWVADPDLVVRAAVRTKPDGTYGIIVRDAPGQPWRTLLEPAPDDGRLSIAGFTPDGSALYALTSFGANAQRLVRIDIASGVVTALVEDAAYDVADVLISRRTKDVIAARVERERAEWQVIDTDYAADFATLRDALRGDFSITICDRADARWIVAEVRDDASPAFWLYERATRTAVKLFDVRPALAGYTLAAMEPIAFAARDGLELHGYLTRPRGVAGALPMVLFVHGGPWARDVWGYNPVVQLLANRGYAVLQVNFRGSSGYGKAFLNAGERQWAGTMRTDLLDAKDWAIEQGIADPARVAIFGGSYGGYATLAALTFTPDAFVCGVDVVGPSNLNTLLKSIPPYWTTVRGEFTRRMGEDEAFLTSQSPLFMADRISAPLFIAQGANDPRVKIAESDQIVAAMRANARPVTYVVFEDEGHGFARPENNRRFVAAMEAFFAEHLGGRSEPPAPGEEIAGFLR